MDQRCALCLAGLVAIYLVDVVLRLRGPPALRRVFAGALVDAVPIEVEASGLRCLDRSVAHAQGLGALDRVGLVEGRLVRRGRMSAQRRWLITGAVELADADAADLVVLPGIGPRLAARLATERRPRDLAELGRVRGVGARRARGLGAMLGLDGGELADICSMGLWPTTSSGCDRPR